MCPDACNVGRVVIAKFDTAYRPRVDPVVNQDTAKGQMDSLKDVVVITRQRHTPPTTLTFITNTESQ